MGLLIQCLRDVRARSGDLDLLPPYAGRASRAADLRGRDSDVPGNGRSPSGADPTLSLALHAIRPRHAAGRESR